VHGTSNKQRRSRAWGKEEGDAEEVKVFTILNVPMDR